jgi:3-hydroxyisobutyrate dehydrogenase-like beta-hydroxyacid dehydrogenase
MRIGFVGLGVMGAPMAGHLARAGHDVVVHNRTAAPASRWAAAHRGTVVSSPAEAAEGADAVCTIVGNDDDVRAVVHGSSGVLVGLGANALLIDHTTTSAVLARELAAAHECFVDAPVSGGQAGAEQGQLTIMCGGTAENVERARAVMSAYAKAITHIGPTGHGQLAKMANQLCIAGTVQGLAEALDFTVRSGVDPVNVIAAISQGAAGSWQMSNRAATMIEGRYDFGFAVDWMVKDLAYTLEEAARCGARLELGELVAGFYREVQAAGGGRWDTSSLLTRLTNDEASMRRE